MLRSAPIILGLLLAGSPAAACELRLLLAMDVSASVSPFEYDLQRSGLSAAFRDAELHEAISGLEGGIHVSVTQWAGPAEHVLSLDWQRLSTSLDAFALAADLDRLENPFSYSSTAVGSALEHAASVLDAGPEGCRRTVIDVSSDGTTNTGIDTSAMADRLRDAGVTINALVVLVDRLEFEESLVPWYVFNVVRGPGGFAMTTPTYLQFAAAIKKKLLREIRPHFAALAPGRVLDGAN